jgi:hypothetical protein
LADNETLLYVCLVVWQVLAMRAGLAKDNKDHGAAKLIQKVFRGHKVRRL